MLYNNVCLYNIDLWGTAIYLSSSSRDSILYGPYKFATVHVEVSRYTPVEEKNDQWRYLVARYSQTSLLCMDIIVDIDLNRMI